MNAIAHSDQTKLPAVGLSAICPSVLPKDDSPLLESVDIHCDEEEKSSSDDEVPQEIEEDHHFPECSTLNGERQDKVLAESKNYDTVYLSIHRQVST